MELIKLELNQLPAVIEQNNGLSSRCTLALKQFADNFGAVVVNGADAQKLAEIDSQANDLVAKASDALQIMESSRKPYTQKFDEVKKIFTTAESEVKDAVESVKRVRVAIAEERARRIKEAEQEKLRKIEAEEARIEVTAKVRIAISKAALNAIQQICDRMYSAFYKQTIESFPNWEQQFKVASVPFQMPTGVIMPVDPRVNVMAISNEISAEMAPSLAKDWEENFEKLKKTILSLIPDRIEELKRAANDDIARQEADRRIAEEAEARRLAAEQEAADRAAAEQAVAEVNKMNAAFDAEAAATPLVQQASGTSVKLKYKADTHAAYVAIIQYWVKNNMAKMTIEELNKKLSFMVTAANDGLNKTGEKLTAEGLEVVEDFTTRVKRA